MSFTGINLDFKADANFMEKFPNDVNIEHHNSNQQWHNKLSDIYLIFLIPNEQVVCFDFCSDKFM